MKENHISSSNILIGLTVLILLGVAFLIYRDISFQKRMTFRMGSEQYQDQEFRGKRMKKRIEIERGNNRESFSCPMQNQQITPTPQL